MIIKTTKYEVFILIFFERTIHNTIKIMKYYPAYKYFLLLTCIMLAYYSHAQTFRKNATTSNEIVVSTQKKQMGYKELAEILYNSNQEKIIFEEVFFYNDLPNKGEESFQSDYNLDGNASVIKGGFQNYIGNTDNSRKKYIPAKEIYFIKCSFESDLRISNTVIEGDLGFYFCNFDSLSGDYVGSGNSDESFGGSLLIDSVEIKGNFTFWDLSLDNHDLLKNRKRYYLKLNNSNFLKKVFLIIPKYTFESKNSIAYEFSIYAEEGNSVFKFLNTKIKKIDVKIRMAKNFSLEKSEWGDAQKPDSFSRISIQADYLSFDSNTFLSSFNFYFEDISKRLWMYKNKYKSTPSIYFSKIPFDSNLDLESLNYFNFNIQGKYNASQKQLSNPEYSPIYKDYVRVNKLLFDYFQMVGDREMANLAYIKVKDIETSLLEYQYRTTSSFSTFFAWQLNRLLKFYTEHGTNPGRALVVSFYILLAFAVFYFFFPSEWDLQSKSKLISNYKDFIEKNAKGYFKPFILLTWNIFISFLNALTLSLNSFTTLGFGNIPTTGFARYICILQGFLGWFLLSLFTVALINQAQL